MLLIPDFGLLIGLVVLGERPTAWTGAGISLVLIGMWLALTTQADQVVHSPKGSGAEAIAEL